jgi:hypothetical protein
MDTHESSCVQNLSYRYDSGNLEKEVEIQKHFQSYVNHLSNLNIRNISLLNILYKIKRIIIMKSC